MNDSEYKKKTIESMGEEMFAKYEVFREEMGELIEKHHLVMADPARTISCIMSSLIIYIMQTNDDNIKEWSNIFVQSLFESKQAWLRGEWG